MNRHKLDFEEKSWSEWTYFPPFWLRHNAWIIFIWLSFCMNYLKQSTNQYEESSGRSQGLFPPRPQAREKTLGTRLRPKYPVSIISVNNFFSVLVWIWEKIVLKKERHWWFFGAGRKAWHTTTKTHFGVVTQSFSSEGWEQVRRLCDAGPKERRRIRGKRPCPAEL